LIEVIGAFLVGRKPDIPDTSVCTECKRRGLTWRHGGRRHAVPRPGHARWVRCALPAVRRGCYGCFGPMSGANLPAA